MPCPSDVYRNLAGKIYGNGIIEFRIKYSREGIGQRLAKFQFYFHITVFEM